MKNITKYFSSGLLASCLLFGANAHAFEDEDGFFKKGWGHGDRGGWFKHGRRHGGMLGPMRHALKAADLSDEQMTQVRQILEDAKPQFREIRQALGEQRRESVNTVMAAEYDPAQVEAVADAQAETIKQMMLLSAETYANIAQLLTPEQLQAIEEKRAEMRQKWEERRQQKQQDRQQNS